MRVVVKYSKSLLFALACGLFLLNCEGNKQRKEEMARPETTDLQKAVLNYLSFPDFTGIGFEELVLPPVAKFLRYDMEDSLVYFSKDTAGVLENLDLICEDTSQIEFGQVIDEVIYLGKYRSRKLESSLFRFPSHLFKPQVNDSLSIDYKRGTYHLNLEELTRYYNREAIYDSPAIFELVENGQRYGIANHSAVIAKSGESSLTNFAQKIVGDLSNQENQYQALLDFVSKEIEYEYITGKEIFFKPNEVLLRRKSDCSGKVVLYASLLEQLDLPYLLVYMDQHILVAVPGKFSKRNNMNFMWDGEWYFFAETTLEGFKIGKTATNLSREDIQYLQKAGNRTRLYDYVKEDSLDFMTMEVAVEE
ncbi:MAG: hypothetical protein MRZ79_12810 [Bacteroidia bacterium]|nr:hypothetical protein [Bacteroidia bacterium]